VPESGDNGAPPQQPEPTAPQEQISQEERERREVEELLGPDVRSPVGIPGGYKPSESSINPLFRVELADFAGPLDLLLYLIRKHEIDIFDIPIKFITDQYLEMLRALKSLEIDLAAEFLVLAAELTHIKSKMLLPAKEGIAVEAEPEEESDPRAELVRRLLEYQKYRDAAEQLADRDHLGRDVFARVPPKMESVEDLDPGLKSISIFKLVELMAKLMKKAPAASHAISFEAFSLSERIGYVDDFARAREGRFTLVQLLQGILSRAELVVTFIAVLEMTKLGLLRISIEDQTERIMDEDIPLIWVHRTEKVLGGDLIDDYR
jgi:segregation and condensation protein A